MNSAQKDNERNYLLLLLEIILWYVNFIHPLLIGAKLIAKYNNIIERGMNNARQTVAYARKTSFCNDRKNQISPSPCIGEVRFTHSVERCESAAKGDTQGDIFKSTGGGTNVTFMEPEIDLESTHENFENDRLQARVNQVKMRVFEDINIRKTVGGETVQAIIVNDPLVQNTILTFVFLWLIRLIDAIIFQYIFSGVRCVIIIVTIVFEIYLMHPTTKGSLEIYVRSGLQDAVEKYSDVIDDQLGTHLQYLGDHGALALLTKLGNVAFNAVGSVLQMSNAVLAPPVDFDNDEEKKSFKSQSPRDIKEKQTDDNIVKSAREVIESLSKQKKE